MENKPETTTAAPSTTQTTETSARWRYLNGSKNQVGARKYEGFVTRDAWDYLNLRCPPGCESMVRNLKALPKLMSFLYRAALVLLAKEFGGPLGLEEIKALVGFATHKEGGKEKPNFVKCSVCGKMFFETWFFDPALLLGQIKELKAGGGEISFAHLLAEETVRGVRHPKKPDPAAAHTNGSHENTPIEWIKMCGAPFVYDERSDVTRYDNSSCYGMVCIAGAAKREAKGEPCEYLWGRSARREHGAKLWMRSREKHRERNQKKVAILVDSIV